MPDITQNILLIESSATQRYVLLQALRAGGDEVDVADSYASGLKMLQSIGESTPCPLAVILGWPAHTEPDADELLVLLEQAPLANIPALILSHEPDAAIKLWASQRPCTAVLDWADRDTLDETLKSLCCTTPLPAISQPAIENDRRPIRLLLVDDSPSVRSYYRKLLINHGYEVDVASSVKEGFRKAEQGQYDIAIIDYFMPVENGDVLCRRLQKHAATRNIVIAMLTGTYLDQVIKDSLDAGATECMFKNEVDDLFLTRISAMSRSIRIKNSIETQRQRLQSILHSVGDGVYGVDNSGRISFINPTALRILGYDDESELLGESPMRRLHHSDEQGRKLSKLASKLERTYGKPDILKNWETVFWSRNNTLIPVECTVFPMYMKGRQEGSVVAFQDISERKAFEEKLRWQASHDALTELFNRCYFEERLEIELERLHRSEEASALLYIDLDRFKYINDTASHDAGDQLLIQVGQRLRSRLRSTDTLARLGGDEFAVLLRNIDPDMLARTANAFRSVLSEGGFMYQGRSYDVHGSVGAALFDRHTQSPGDVLAHADIACHIAKKEGGNHAHIYVDSSDFRSEMGRDLNWSTRLRKAIDQDHFELYFQPILPLSAIDLDDLPSQSGAIWAQIARNPSQIKMCFEVLIRLKSRDELIMPGAFLPTAERFHLMPEIDCWVMRHAIRQLAGFRTIWKDVIFSVNLAGQTLVKADLVDTVKRLLHEYKVDPSSLSFEITETSAIANIPAAQKVINELGAIGCHFSLDDFGTGFSSFSHLKHLAVDCIKIDGMFVRGMSHDPTDHAMVISMNDIAHFLGQTTVAEFVEDRETLRILAETGVDYVQGYYLSSPVPEQVARCESPQQDSLEPCREE